MTTTWCQLGAASVDRGVLSVRCKGGAVDEDGSAPDYGAAPMMCALGLTAMPAAPSEKGTAEALVARDVPGISGVVFACRDTRTANIVGQMEPGDTCLHSTGDQQAAMVMLKETKRIAAVITKTSGGKTMMVVLDGDAEEIQITSAGALFKIEKNGDISIVNGGGAGILLQGGNVHFLGNPVLGAGNPPLCFMLGPPTGSPGGPASAPLFPCMGVTPG